VPETPWNETCSNPLTLGYMQEFFQAIFGNAGPYYEGSNGSTYGINDVEESCNAIYSDYQIIEEENAGFLLNLVNTVGGSGGASNCVVNSTSPTGTTFGTCTTGATSTGSTTNPGTGAAQGSLPVVNNGWAKPSWQTGVQGIPNDQVRDLPDMSFFASDGFVSDSAYLICVSEDSTADPECSYSSNVEPFAQEVGGTSVATPAMAAVMALINQKTGEAQGLANPELYKLAASQTYGACSAEIIANSPTSPNNCYFYDIDTGTIAMPCDATDSSPNCNVAHSGDYLGILSGYSATSGYDQATGLGSLNVANVVNAWPQTLGAGKAAITITPGVTSLNSNNTLSVTVTLASSPSGGVTPTGEVTLTASGSTYSQTVTSSNGSYSFTIPADSLTGVAAPGTTVTLTANYAGDSVYAASSNTTTITVITVAGTGLIPTITVTPASAMLNSNASLNVVVTVAGTGVTPTGTVTLSGGGYSSSTATLTNGTYTFSIPANSLASGADKLTVNYSGDGNYAALSSSATVTVTESTFTLNLPAVTVTPSTVAPGGSATAVVTVAAAAGYTGTVSLTCQQTSGPSTGDGASCTLAGGSSVTLTSGTTSGTVTFNVGTTAPQAAAVNYPQIRKNGWAGAGTGAVLAVLMLIGIPARRRSWRQMLGVMVLMVALGGLAGCGSSSTNNGGGGQTDPGTAAGTYTFTVQATGNPSVTPAVETTFNVIVN
jgi:hypothetical protein